MSAEENKQTAKDGYAAFGRKDAEAAMAGLSDSIEWVVGGDSAVTGTYHGKEELGGLWAQLAGTDFTNEPTEFIADGDKVAVVTKASAGGEEGSTVDILEFDDDGKVVRFEAFGGERVLDAVFPK